jgi:hypothetical protein
MHKSATKCNETLGKWCKNKHGASKIIDTLQTYQFDRVVSRLPLFVKQYINAKAPLKFKRRLEVEISKIQASKLYPVFWHKHITLRMIAMLSRRCLKIEDED